MSFILFKKIISHLLLFHVLIIKINSQLTIQDKENIEKFIMNGQSKSTALFFEGLNALKSTREAINALKILGLEVKHKTEICKTISDKEIDINIVLINKFLYCKMNLKNYKPDTNKNNLNELFHVAQIMGELGIDQWSGLYKKVMNFYSQGEGKFSFYRIKEKKDKSILATAIGVEILCLIANNEPKLKNEILPYLQKSVDTLMKSYSQLSEDMIAFIEKKVGAYHLNYHVVSATKAAKKLGIEIPLFNNLLYKLLNYFNTFKYEMISNIDNTFYLLNIYKLLDKIPLMKVSKDNFNYLTEKKIKISFENIFGQNLEVKNTTIKIDIKENKDKNPKTANNKNSKKKSSYDLDDDENEKEQNLGKKIKNIEIKSPKKEVDIDLGEAIIGPGNFILSLNMLNKQYSLEEHLFKNIRSFSEVKIDSVDFEIIDKIKDENNNRLSTIKYPQKYSDILKATQDHSLIARVKVSFPGGKKPTLIEQVFLRLTNKELQKSYNAYASKFDLENNEYFIGFELDDPVNMESYNGIYEISIIMSDPNIKEVLKWEFGKIEISFTKPSDPQDVLNSLKNNLQPKMEPTFSPEPKREKNLLIGSIFSFIILGLTFMLLIILIKSDSNVNNFPKHSFGFLMNILFIGVLGSVAYILFLFWIKLNILQTMFIFVIMSIPASFIVYKALKNHKIEINVYKEED